MNKARLVELFSAERMSNYKDENEHMRNFTLIEHICVKLGILEIVTRNRVACVLGLDDSKFVSQQSFGYWIRQMNECKIHNKVVDFGVFDFRKYSEFNRPRKILNFQKVQIAYLLALTIRNRAFHFENLLKLYDGNRPRINVKSGGFIIGVMPDKIEMFLDDMLDIWDIEAKYCI